MSAEPSLLDRLIVWKTRYGSPDGVELETLLTEIAKQPFSDAPGLIRIHETLLFLRAYPHSAVVARLADAFLRTMAGRVAKLRRAGAGLEAFEDPAVSGIAGTAFTAVFSYEVACQLAARYRTLSIDWEAYDEPERLGPVLRRFLPLVGEDWPVEAHSPFREWMRQALPRGQRALPWLLDRIARLGLSARDRADLYDSLQLPLYWELGNELRTRSLLRLKRGSLFYHKEPLLRRNDVSLNDALTSARLPVARLSKREGARILEITLDTSAMRYRQLYGFSHPDTARLYHAQAGRGLDVYFFGVPPEWRLPLRAYHAAMFFKNGVPAGYVEVLSLFDRAEIGFNLYYTFREGESAWIYARLLQLIHQMLGVSKFVVDPYQLGDENEEALDSGAFWFYRKLGFSPVDPAVARLVEREEHRMTSSSGYHSNRATLRKLARGYMCFEGPMAQAGVWDRFEWRKLGFKAQHKIRERPDASQAWDAVLAIIPDYPQWPADDRRRVNEILLAKSAPEESRYLRLMQRHAKLREAVLRLGSE